MNPTLAPPALFTDSTPETRRTAGKDPGTTTWREPDLRAARVYALTLDKAACVMSHPNRDGARTIWFGLRLHGKPDHDARLEAMRLALTQADLTVHQQTDGEVYPATGNRNVIGLLVVDA